MQHPPRHGSGGQAPPLSAAFRDESRSWAAPHSAALNCCYTDPCALRLPAKALAVTWVCGHEIQVVVQEAKRSGGVREEGAPNQNTRGEQVATDWCLGKVLPPIKLRRKRGEAAVASQGWASTARRGAGRAPAAIEKLPTKGESGRAGQSGQGAR